MGSQTEGLPPEKADRATRALRRFLKVESAAGVLLLVATAGALIVSNSPLSRHASAFWETSFGFQLGPHAFTRSLRHWINDGLMTFFFFVVALELKREMAQGELRSIRKAAFPLAGALGGMLVPALIYLALMRGSPELNGWGIVMATDTAFVLGGLAVLGRRVPTALRIFLLSLAIFDDVGAILVVGIAYGGRVSWLMLLLALAFVAAILVTSRVGIRSVVVYVLLGCGLWLGFDASGIHPSIAGVVLGLMTPAREWITGERLQSLLARVVAHPTSLHRRDLVERQDLRWARVAATEAVSPVERIEMRIHPWSGFVIMPVFALANAGVELSREDLGRPVFMAVFLGLAIGKPAGVLGMSWLAARVGVATRPPELAWPTIAAGSLLAGIGFTMSIFIAGLAFDSPTLETAKLAILSASAVSSALGLSALFWLSSRRARPSHSRRSAPA